MKKISALILILVLLFAMFSLTSCGSEEKLELNSYEDFVHFIYGDSDAADFFANFKPFTTVEAAIDGFKQLGKTVGNGLSNCWNKIVEFFTNLADHPILFILAILPISIASIFVLMFGALIAFIVALFLLLFLFYAVLVDALFLLYYGLSLIIMAICRFAAYFLVDLGWGERFYKLFSNTSKLDKFL